MPIPRAEPVALSLLLPLVGPRGADPPNADLLRRGVLRQLERWRAQATRDFHDDPGSAGHGWTVSDPLEHHLGLWFRVTAAGTSAAFALAHSLGEGGPLVPNHWRIGSAALWGLMTATIDELSIMGSYGPSERVGVVLLSPTTFSPPVGEGHDPLPTVGRLFGGWARRWTAHLDSAHPLSKVIGDGDRMERWMGRHLRVVDASLRTERRSRGPVRAARGVVGSVEFVLKGDRGPERDAVRALARFACFCGTGRHLSFGFGQTLTTVGGLPGEVGAQGDAVLFSRHRFG